MMIRSNIPKNVSIIVILGFIMLLNFPFIRVKQFKIVKIVNIQYYCNKILHVFKQIFIF